MNTTDIVNQAMNHLTGHTGITGEWKEMGNEIDGTLELCIENNNVQFYVEVKKELREYQLPKIIEIAQFYWPMMVIAERIFPNLKEKLRANKIGYLDGAGNIYLNTEGNYVWMEGHKNTELEKPVNNRAFTKTGLKTVFHLLLEEDAINKPYRALAQASNVALGNIKNVIEGLKETGFILQVNEKKMLIQNKKALLDRWIAGYRETLKPSLHLGTYRFFKPHDNANAVRQVPLEQNKTVWGGEPAAEIITGYLNPQILTTYTTEKRNDFIPKWRLVPDPYGDLQVYEKFWKDQKDRNKKTAPELLVYADLMITDDPRCIETAKMIYDNYLKNEFERY